MTTLQPGVELKNGEKKCSTQIQAEFSKEFHWTKMLKCKKFLFWTCHNKMFQIKLLGIDPVFSLKLEEPESLRHSPFDSGRLQLKHLLSNQPCYYWIVLPCLEEMSNCWGSEGIWDYLGKVLGRRKETCALPPFVFLLVAPHLLPTLLPLPDLHWLQPISAKEHQPFWVQQDLFITCMYEITEILYRTARGTPCRTGTLWSLFAFW